jgi:hypothetical protein
VPWKGAGCIMVIGWRMLVCVCVYVCMCDGAYEKDMCHGMGMRICPDGRMYNGDWVVYACVCVCMYV